VKSDASPAQVRANGKAYLTLRALEQTFALPLEFARSVFKIDALTRVPLASSHVVGLSYLRGGIVAIVCLARRLQPDAPALGVGASAVAVELGVETFVLAVEEIGDIIHAHAEDVSAIDDHADLRRSGMMAGVIRSGSALLPVLDPFGIFDVARAAAAA
jgi:chemotaxis signal transduction protein